MLALLAILKQMRSDSTLLNASVAAHRRLILQLFAQQLPGLLRHQAFAGTDIIELVRCLRDHVAQADASVQPLLGACFADARAIEQVVLQTMLPTQSATAMLTKFFMHTATVQQLPQAIVAWVKALARLDQSTGAMDTYYDATFAYLGSLLRQLELSQVVEVFAQAQSAELSAAEREIFWELLECIAPRDLLAILNILQVHKMPLAAQLQEDILHCPVKRGACIRAFIRELNPALLAQIASQQPPLLYEMLFFDEFQQRLLTLGQAAQAICAEHLKMAMRTEHLTSSELCRLYFASPIYREFFDNDIRLFVSSLTIDKNSAADLLRLLTTPSLQDSALVTHIFQQPKLLLDIVESCREAPLNEALAKLVRIKRADKTLLAHVVNAMFTRNDYTALQALLQGPLEVLNELLFHGAFKALIQSPKPELAMVKKAVAQSLSLADILSVANPPAGGTDKLSVEAILTQPEHGLKLLQMRALYMALDGSGHYPVNTRKPISAYASTADIEWITGDYFAEPEQACHKHEFLTFRARFLNVEKLPSPITRQHGRGADHVSIRVMTATALSSTKYPDMVQNPSQGTCGNIDSSAYVTGDVNGQPLHPNNEAMQPVF